MARISGILTDGLSDRNLFLSSWQSTQRIPLAAVVHNPCPGRMQIHFRRVRLFGMVEA